MTCIALSSSSAYSVSVMPVDLELSLVVDVSGSVSGSEYTLQMEGYAAAFESASLQSAISSTNKGIAVNLIQFSTSAQESISWTLISDATSANAFATQVRGATRLFSSGTNIDAGINAATTSINNNLYEGTRKVIDVSGDGTGTASGTSRDNALANGITTINGIVISSDPGGSLQKFYENNVAGGQGAFVASSPTFKDFEPEVLKKISREVTGIDNNGFPVAAALRQTQLSLVHAGLNDVNSRLFRLRTRRPAPAAPEPVIPSSDKGSHSAKGAKDIIPTPQPAPKRWQAFGSLHAYTEDVDRQNYTITGSTFSFPILPDYEIDIFGGTVGIEYTLNQNWTFGSALISNNADVDMGNFGDIDTDGYALAAYASYFQENAFGGKGDWYTDLLVSYGDYDNDIKRTTFGGSARGTTDSDSYTAQLSTGYNLTNGSWIHGPFSSLAYTDGDVDGYTETGPGATTFPDMEFESLIGRLGYKVSKIINSSKGTFIPQVRIAWEHEFKNDQVTIGSLTLGAPDEDRLVLGTGVAWEFSQNGSIFLNYEGRFADDLESHLVSLRLGLKF